MTRRLPLTGYCDILKCYRWPSLNYMKHLTSFMMKLYPTSDVLLSTTKSVSMFFRMKKCSRNCLQNFSAQHIFQFQGKNPLTGQFITYHIQLQSEKFQCALKVSTKLAFLTSEVTGNKFDSRGALLEQIPLAWENNRKQMVRILRYRCSVGLSWFLVHADRCDTECKIVVTTNQKCALWRTASKWTQALVTKWSPIIVCTITNNNLVLHLNRTGK